MGMKRAYDSCQSRRSVGGGMLKRSKSFADLVSLQDTALGLSQLGTNIDSIKVKPVLVIMESRLFPAVVCNYFPLPSKGPLPSTFASEEYSNSKRIVTV